MKIKRIIRKILAILIPVAITCLTYPMLSDYYFTSTKQMKSANFVATYWWVNGLTYWNNALVAGAVIIIDCIAWLFGIFIFSGDEE